MNKPLVFISHIAEEKEIALALKNLIESSFLEMIAVFVSSDFDSINLGQKWLDNITVSLKNCAMEIIICSPVSVKRQWINFEAGAGWVRDIPVIPLCHSGMLPSELPIPMNLLQAAIATEESSLKQIFPVLARAIESTIPDANFGRFISKVKDFEISYRKEIGFPDSLSDMKIPEPSLPHLSDEAKQLLIEMSLDSSGRLLVAINQSGGDLIIQTHGKSLCNTNNPRTLAAWKDAVDQLESLHLIKNESKTKYSITTRGFHVADILKVIPFAKAEDDQAPN